MKKLWAWLDGKKTVIGLVAGSVVGVLASAGAISLDNIYVQLVLLAIGLWTGVSYRAAIKKSGLPEA